MSNENQIPICADTIGELDEGRFKYAINQAVLNAWKDIQDRPCNVGGKTEKRKVIITLELEPQVRSTETGYILEAVHLTPKVKCMAPETVGNPIDCRHKQGALHFNRGCSHNFNQEAFAFEDEEEYETEDE